MIAAMLAQETFRRTGRRPNHPRRTSCSLRSEVTRPTGLHRPSLDPHPYLLRGSTSSVRSTCRNLAAVRQGTCSVATGAVE